MPNGFFTGLESGMKLGLLAREIRNKEKAAELEEEKLSVLAKKEAAQQKLTNFKEIVLDRFDKMITINPAYAPMLWPNMRAGVKEQFGLDMGELTEEKIGGMKRISKILDSIQKGDLTWDQASPLISIETTSLTKPETDQVKDIVTMDLGYIAAKGKVDGSGKKEMTPEDAAKRWSEITSSVAKMSKLGEMQTMAVAANPALADNKDFMKAITYNPDEVNQMQGAFLNEMRVIAPHLPADQRPRFYTRDKFALAKSEYEKALGRKVSDAEMYSRVIPID